MSHVVLSCLNDGSARAGAPDGDADEAKRGDEIDQRIGELLRHARGQLDRKTPRNRGDGDGGRTSERERSERRLSLSSAAKLSGALSV
jgi:hypothetical protein